jgi:hypothetical protein
MRPPPSGISPTYKEGQALLHDHCTIFARDLQHSKAKAEKAMTQGTKV